MREQGLVARRASTGGRADLKPPLKEKFVSVYEAIFQEKSPIQAARQEGFAGRQALQRFWDELLLLKVNEAYLSQCIAMTPEDKLTGSLRPTINELFGACARYMTDGNFIRVAHAVETFTVLLREIFKKRFSEQAFTIITLVAGGADNGDAFFKRLIGDVSQLLVKEDVPALIKALGTRLFLVILTGTDNVNTNPIASFLFVHPISEPLLSVLTLKVPHERQRLELDASIVLILLLLWRSSTNLYADQVSSPSGPLVSLLHTTASLLSRPKETRQPHALLSPSAHRHAEGLFHSPHSSSSSNGLLPSLSFLPDSVAGPATSAFTMVAAATAAVYEAAVGAPSVTSPRQGGGGGGGGDVVVDLGWSNTTAASLLLYFLVHHNPALRSPVLWPAGGFSAAQGQSLALLWSDVLRSFLLHCQAVFASIEGAPSVPQGQSAFLGAKVVFLIQRMLLEDRVSGDFLMRCDPITFQVAPPLPPSPTASPSPSANGLDRSASMGSRSIAHVFFDSAVLLLSVPLPVLSSSRSNTLSSSASLATPASSAAAVADVDAYVRALTVVAVVINSAKVRGVPLSSHNVDWMALWRALILICDWCSADAHFQRPGVPELAESALGLMEACLGGGCELVASPEDVEVLHAMVFAFMSVFEELERTAEKSPFASSKFSVTGGFKLVNIKAVRDHYEVMAASMGIRGTALGGSAMTEEQAMAVIRKKGLATLKLRPRHAGPAHGYSEGNSELRILTAMAKSLVAEHRRTFWLSLPKFELENF